MSELFQRRAEPCSKTAEYIIFMPPHWTGPTMGQNLVHRCENSNGWWGETGWNGERMRCSTYKARGQCELIFLLSYPLASLAVLAVRWWIHWFFKFVCNHCLYVLLSYLSGPPFSVFLISFSSPVLPCYSPFSVSPSGSLTLFCSSSFSLVLLQSISFSYHLASSKQ